MAQRHQTLPRFTRLADCCRQNNLRVTWAHLQKALGTSDSDEQPHLIGDRLTLRFNPLSDHELDVASFRALIQACRIHPHSDQYDCAECAARLTQALDLVRGDFLDEFSLGDCLQFDEWLTLQREHFRVQGVVIELLVLQALALAMARQIPPAVAALEEALRLAESEGYARIFLDEGEPMARLLRMVYRSKEKGSREYETKLLEGLLLDEAPLVSPELPAGKSVDHPVLIDPLSERELEVLRMIAEGRSNQEIAEKLVITMGTVKAHISHIYNKLDARSRTQAVLKAEEFHLLKP